MRFKGEKLFCKWFDCPPPQLDSFSSGVVNGPQVDQCRGQCKYKVQLILGCHVGCSSLPLLGTLLRLLALLLTLGSRLLGLLLLLDHCSLWWLLGLISLWLWQLLGLLLLLDRCSLWWLLGLISLWLQQRLGLLLICYPCRLHDHCCL